MAEGLAEVVDDGNNGGIVDDVGNVTPEQRLVTLEPAQHESVAFGELVPQ